MKATISAQLAVVLIGCVMPAIMHAQGLLTPPSGSPAPTQKSLQEIWEEIADLKSQNAALAAQLAAFQELVDPPFVMTMVPVGRVGNPADPANSGSIPGIGAVSYPFSIGKYEVTNGQYIQFLNAVAAEDPNRVYRAGMATDARGGITRSGSPGSYRYQEKPNMGNKPVNYVSWYSAIRFCNWMHNGRPVGAQGAGTTEGGAYTLTAQYAVAVGTHPEHGTNGRNAEALFWLPSENEWYKAAYHTQRTRNGITADVYGEYPTSVSMIPLHVEALANGDPQSGTNTSNFDGEAEWNGVTGGNVTTVGLSESWYKAADMGGNVAEWNEEMMTSDSRGIRGGSWGSPSSDLQKSSRGGFLAVFATSSTGFRVAGP